jgi:hypothetical protein
MCALTIAGSLLNFFPDRVGMWGSATDPSALVPVLAPEIRAHLPWLNLWWGALLVLGVVRLYLGRATVLTRLVDVVLSVLGTVILARIALGGQVGMLSTELVAVKFALAVSFAATITGAIVKLGLLLEGKQAVIRLADV